MKLGTKIKLLAVMPKSQYDAVCSLIEMVTTECYEKGMFRCRVSWCDLSKAQENVLLGNKVSIIEILKAEDLDVIIDEFESVTIEAV